MPSWPLYSRFTYIHHSLPALSFSTKQWLGVSKASIIDAHINTLMQGLDGGEHGEDVLLV